MEKYQGIIDAVLNVCAEGAKLTENTWDDAAVAAARNVFEAVFGPVRFGAPPLSADAAESVAIGQAELPPWAVPIIVEIIRWIISRR